MDNYHIIILFISYIIIIGIVKRAYDTNVPDVVSNCSSNISIYPINLLIIIISVLPSPLHFF